MSAEHDQLMLPQLPQSLTWGYILLPEAPWYMWTQHSQSQEQMGNAGTDTYSQGEAIIIAYYLGIPAQLKFSAGSEVPNVPPLSVWIPNLANT